MKPVLLLTHLAVALIAYAVGFEVSSNLHGDWIISRVANGTTCTGIDIATGKSLGQWHPTIDWDGFARCHPRGALNAMMTGGFYAE